MYVSQMFDTSGCFEMVHGADRLQIEDTSTTTGREITLSGIRRSSGRLASGISSSGNSEQSKIPL